MSLKTFQKYCRQNDFAGQDELYVDEEATVDYGNDRTIAAHSKEHEEAEAAWKETFYEKYYKKFRNMKNTTLITQEKYNRVVETIIELWRIKSKGCKKIPIPREALKFNRIYELKGNINERCLYRNNLLVITYEEVFDVIKKMHISLEHARDIKKRG